MIHNVLLFLGLPWRVMHSDFKVENPENSSLLLNVLKV